MNNKKGFTLIELLIVVIIIGILTAIALPQYKKAVRKSRLSELSVISKTLMQAIDAYILQNGFPAEKQMFTIPNSPLDVKFPWTCDDDIRRCYTKIGQWNCGCTDHHCGITLGTAYNEDGTTGNNWLNGGYIQLWRGTDNSGWKLQTVPKNEEEQKLICDWWLTTHGASNIVDNWDGNNPNAATYATACNGYL